MIQVANKPAFTVANHFVGAWELGALYATDLRRVHKLKIGHQWFRYAETWCAGGGRSYSQICPENTAPDASFTPISEVSS